ncbi:hypothetical protein [Haloplanus salilacus]|uniref:hypothetical protein n=1 Tax=Haloplanus salilacus TaxID=2949994 RepID=UPI0030CB372A
MTKEPTAMSDGSIERIRNRLQFGNKPNRTVMTGLDDPPVLPAGVEVRAAEAIDRREIESLCESRTGFSISQVLDAVFHDEKLAYGFAATEVERVIGFGVVICLPSDDADDRFSVR